MSSVPEEAPQNSPDQTVSYEERLWPSFWIWLIAAGFSAATIVMFAPISMVVGYTVAVVVAIIVGTLLILSTPRIVVTDTTLTVGRATIERSYLGDVGWYTGDDATHQRGPGLHGLAYLCIRGWISPVVRIELTDPEDRTPYWLVSSRTPERLVEALTR
ncbi:DUF3093 domain-containing protein [Arthrobacter agilis]|uniref:DUF3093 domain-containing protein n=1 Tax=Arthrobacter agilis TaxID=37921 RepID=UPI000B35D9CA|nr:DUF3093 domain-containing protein [Arthrobacter agilis]OUM44998.1 hypothetical protein B8W74_01765 [Arthrobacter agilis]PPB46935.1 DUF3093 domain-containing protein [Arthrobacter agilis]TPV23472.1 DUF3093 domain-containing protein [Arthrobacter agilis]VDR31861.1 Protein of uncharacterised function (DUF3093) [Arthrobacter agilis]